MIRSLREPEYDAITIDEDGTVYLDTSEGNGLFVPDDQKFYWGSDLDVSLRWDDTNTVFIIEDDGTREFVRFDPGSEVAFNEDGAAVDFRVEAQNVADMLHVFGGTDQVGIGEPAAESDWGALNIAPRDTGTGSDLDLVATLADSGDSATLNRTDPGNLSGVRIGNPEVTASSSSTVTDAAALYVPGPLQAGTNVTFSNSFVALLEDGAGNKLLTLLDGGTAEIHAGPLNLSGGDLQRNGTAVVGTQESAIGSLTNNQTDTTTDDTLESIGDTSSSDESAPIERNLSELNSQIDSILTALRNHGLIAS